ncbi:MAG: hypothetical protein CMM81_06050 [Rhodospirillales bacterium]|jgi:hypothetical protein|nr:hypothetical protein [Rhodospirillales bacterium]
MSQIGDFYHDFSLGFTVSPVRRSAIAVSSPRTAINQMTPNGAGIIGKVDTMSDEPKQNQDHPCKGPHPTD